MSRALSTYVSSGCAVYDLATRMWFKYVFNHPTKGACGHPGVSGPSGDPNEKWDSYRGHVIGALETLKECREVFAEQGRCA